MTEQKLVAVVEVYKNYPHCEIVEKEVSSKEEFDRVAEEYHEMMNRHEIDTFIAWLERR